MEHSALNIHPNRHSILWGENALGDAPSTYSKKIRAGFYQIIKHCLDFSFVFSAPLHCLKKPVLSKRDLLRWKVPAMYWDLLTSGKVSQPLTISIKWKNLSSALRRKRTWVHALLLYRNLDFVNKKVMTRSKWFRTIDITEEEGGGHFALLTKCDSVGFQRVGHPHMRTVLCSFCCLMITYKMMIWSYSIVTDFPFWES